MGNFKNEELCTKCGICCYLVLRDGRGGRFFTPFHCQFLNLDTKQCGCYEDRYTAFKACSNVGPATRQGVLPTGCPYTVDEEGYAGPAQDYRNSPRVKKLVEKAIAKGPDENGLYTVQGLKYKLDGNWSPETVTYGS